MPASKKKGYSVLALSILPSAAKTSIFRCIFLTSLSTAASDNIRYFQTPVLVDRNTSCLLTKVASALSWNSFGVTQMVFVEPANGERDIVVTTSLGVCAYVHSCGCLLGLELLYLYLNNYVYNLAQLFFSVKRSAMLKFHSGRSKVKVPLTQQVVHVQASSPTICWILGVHPHLKCC